MAKRVVHIGCRSFDRCTVFEKRVYKSCDPENHVPAADAVSTPYLAGYRVDAAQIRKFRAEVRKVTCKRCLRGLLSNLNRSAQLACLERDAVKAQRDAL